MNWYKRAITLNKPNLYDDRLFLEKTIHLNLIIFLNKNVVENFKNEDISIFFSSIKEAIGISSRKVNVSIEEFKAVSKVNFLNLIETGADASQRYTLKIKFEKEEMLNDFMEDLKRKETYNCCRLINFDFKDPELFICFEQNNSSNFLKRTD